jgi:TRAP-type C4-dicarboxylate transport system permease small subunit
MQQLELWLGRLATLALWISGVALVVMTAIIGVQVALRYGTATSLVWSEPVVILMMSWFTFLGAAVGTREGFHLSFDVLMHVLPPRGRRVLAALSDVIVGGFGLAMAVYGAQLAASAWPSTLPTLGLPGGVTYLPLVAGGTLIALFSAERLVRRATGHPVADMGPGHAPAEG